MQSCTGCGAQHRPGQRFCGECGLALAAACAACGAVPDRAGQRFCGDCGAPLPKADAAALASGAVAGSGAVAASAAGVAVGRQRVAGSRDALLDAAPVSQRRLCSVLFADLVGFTPLSAVRDPEEVRELLSRYFEVCRSVIERHGGMVEKFIGDAVMAVWGTPVSSEQDPERAVRAALELVDAVAALGEEVGAAGLAARAGVVTGEVAVTVGAVGEGMVAGDAVNTAARVQTAAAPGSVLVDESTRRLAAAVIGFTDTGEHELKGKRAPERLWRATRVLAGAGGQQRPDGLEAPLAGRGVELRLVKELFHAAVERSTPRLVVLSGPVGVGKSRLGWEFEKYLDGLPATTWWHRGRCLSYGDGVAYWALAQAVRQRLGIAEEDPSEQAAAKLADGLTRIVPDPAEREFVAVRLGRLLGVPVAADAGTAMGREELFAGWRVFFERLAASAPVVWVVEDAQNADAALLEFIDHLVDWVRDLPVFVLVLARSDLTQIDPGFGVGRNRTLLALDPLDPAAMRSVVDALVPGMPASALELIVARAQGVPLFAVETIRSLLDRGEVQPVDGRFRLVGDLGQLSVPDSLRGLLAARLDALPPRARTLVGDAAVLGTSFPAHALVAVSGQDESAVRAALAELVRREVLEVLTDPRSPERGEYRFSQELLRQVAYETLSRRDRKARHLAVAAHLRAAFADDGSEVAEAVARHYRDALAAVPDDRDVPELRATAVEMTARAAHRAEHAGAPGAAASAYTSAAELALAADGVGGADGLRGSRRDAAGWLERASLQAYIAGRRDDAVELARRALALHEELGDDRGVARARNQLGYALSGLGQVAEARAELESAVQVLREEPDEDTVHAVSRLADCMLLAGDPAAAAELAMQALDLADAVEADDSTYAVVLLILAAAKSGENRRLAALLVEHAATLAERCGNRRMQAVATACLGDLHSGFDWAAAEEATRTGAELIATVGDLPNSVVARMNLLGVLLVRGDWSGARNLLQDATADAEGLAEEAYLAAEDALLAGLTGDTVRGAEALSRLETHRGSELVEHQAWNALADAAVAWGRGDLRRTVAAARAALDCSASLGSRHEVVMWAWPLAARSARLLDDSDAIEDLLASLGRHRPGQVPPLLRAEADLARAYLVRRRDPAAPEASVLLDGAVAAMRAVPAPYFLAGALLDRGDDADLAEAAQITSELGALPLAAHVLAGTTTRT